MADLPVSITLSASDDASSAIAKVRDAMGGLGEAASETGKKADETTSAFDRIKHGMEEGFGLGLGYAGFRDLRDVIDTAIDTVVGFNAQLETMDTRLENLTGSVGATTEALDAVREQAEASPFEFKDIEAGEERLLRFNFSIDESSKLLKVAADAAAGGAGSVDLITEAFGRMNTKEELTSRGLMSLTAAGIPVFDMLAQGLNVSTAQAEDLVKKGLIPAKEGIDILSAAIEAKFPDMAAKVATGFDATVKNLKETVAFAAAEMGKPLFDVLESAVRDALVWLKSPDVKGALDDFSANVASTVRDVVGWFRQLGSAMSQPEVQENLHAAWENIRDIGSELWGLVRDFFIPQQHVLNDSLGVGGVESANSFAGQLKILSGELRDFTGGVKEAIGFLDTINTALNNVKDAGDSVATMIHNQLIGGLQEAVAPLRNLLDMLNELSMIADKVFHIKIDIPGQAGLQAFLDSIHNVQTVGAGGGGGGGGGSDPTAVAPYTIAGSAATLRPSQFNDPALSADEAATACGPAAAVAFAKANGMYPTLREAQDIAEKIGWTASGGMNGIANEQALLSNMGLAGSLNQTPSESQIQTGANTGSGEIISTPGHFFTATGYDATSGQYNVGSSGTDLIGGSAQMTLSQIQTMEGQVNGILTDIHSLTSTAASSAATGGTGGGTLQDVEQAAAIKYKIDPTLFVRQMQEEGGLNTDGSPRTSPAGAVGVAQFMPETAAGLGVDPRDTSASVDAAAKYMAQLTKDNGGDVRKALMAYNAGQGNVNSGAAATFPETQGYVADIMSGTGRAAGVPGVSGQASQGPASPGTGSTPAINAPTTADMAAKVAEPLTDTFAKLIRDSTTKLTSIQTTEDKSLASAATQYAPGGTADRAAEADATKKTTALDTNKAIADDAAQRKAAVAQEVADDTDRENQRLASEAVTYNRNLQDQATIHSRKLEDDQILVNQQLANVALVHQRDLQDAQTVHQQTLALAATRHQQDLQDAQTLVSQQIANVQLLHQRSLQDAQVPVTEQLQAQATVHSRTLQDAEVQYQYERDLGKAKSDDQRKQIETTHQDNLENIAHQRDLQNAEIAYQQGLAAAALAKQRADQDAEIKYQDDQKAQQVAAQRVTAATESQYQMGLAAEETKYQRGLQDTEVVYQQGLAAQALVRSRALADEQTAYNRGLEDQAAAHTAELAATARAFAATEKAKVDAVDKQLADEAFARQKQQVLDDLAAKKASIAEEYSVRVTAAVETARIARETLKTSVDQSAQDQIDAAIKALAGFNGAGDPIIAKMKADWAGFDALMATATTDDVGNNTKIQTAQAATAASATAATSTITTAVGQVNTAYVQSAVDISHSLGITDTAVETSAAITGATWDDARADLNDMVAAYGVGSQQISAAFGITDKAVEQYAIDHHTNWDKARTDLNAAALHAGTVLGTGGTIPTAAGITTAAFDAVQTAAAKTSPLDQLKHAAQELAAQGLDPASKAARDLQTAIQDIKDRTITVTTNFVNNGSPEGSRQAANAADNGTSGISEGSNRNVLSSSSGPTGGGPVADTSPSSPFPSHIGESGPGGIYNNPQTGKPYTHAAGGVTTGPVGGIFGEAGPEAIIPLNEYLISHKSESVPPVAPIDYDRFAFSITRAFQDIKLHIDQPAVNPVANGATYDQPVASGATDGLQSSTKIAIDQLTSAAQSLAKERTTMAVPAATPDISSALQSTRTAIEQLTLAAQGLGKERTVAVPAPDLSTIAFALQPVIAAIKDGADRVATTPRPASDNMTPAIDYDRFALTTARAFQDVKRHTDQPSTSSVGAASPGYTAPITVGEHGSELFTPSTTGGSNSTPNGGGSIDYDKLAEALAKQPITVQVNGETLGRMVRDELFKMKQRNGSIGIGV